MASFAGTAIIQLHQLLTALFVITALYAAIMFDICAVGWHSDCNGLVRRRHRRVFVGL